MRLKILPAYLEQERTLIGERAEMANKMVSLGVAHLAPIGIIPIFGQQSTLLDLRIKFHPLPLSNS